MGASVAMREGPGAPCLTDGGRKEVSELWRLQLDLNVRYLDFIKGRFE